MEVTITGRHMSVPQKVQDRINEKIGGLDKYHDKIQSIKVVVEENEAKTSAEIETVINIPGRDPLVLTEKESSLFAAIDVLHDKAERQLTKLKEKLKSHK
jgi:putative sigma-54 modulation protein